MRGRPGLPPDVVFLEAEWSISDVTSVTTGWHLLCPGADGATPDQLDLVLQQWILNPMVDLLDVLGTDVTCSALRLTSGGSTPVRILEQPSPNLGATGTTDPLNGALVLTWRTQEPGLRNVGHTFLPLSDSFTDTDHQAIAPIRYAEAQSAAIAYVQHVAAMVSPDGGNCVLGVLHQSAAGAPLPAATISPVVYGDASRFVGTLRRRIRSRGRPSSHT